MEDQQSSAGDGAEDRRASSSETDGRSSRLSLYARGFFWGPNGFRAGWRLLLYLAMVFVVGSVLALILRHSGVHIRAQIGQFLISESISVAAVFLPVAVLSRIERRPFGAYGLPGQGAFGKQFWVGSLWGLAWLSILLLVMRGLGAFYFGGLAIHGERIAKFAVFYAVLFLAVGFFEEFGFRGYTLFTLTQGIGFWPSAVILSVLFGAVHLGNKGEALIGALAAAGIGLFFCLTLRRTGNLWFAIGFHAAWDWAETFLYSVPDSGQMMPGHLLKSSFHGAPWLTGGSVGPEGSVLVLILITAMWFAFGRAYPQVKYAT